jgi:ceroid-lipofuscinosis MFS transporter 7
MYALQENRYEFGFLVFDQYSAAAYFMAILAAATLAILITKFKNRVRTKPIRKKPSSRRAERDEVADRTMFCGITVYDAAILGCMLLNFSTKGSIGSFETLGINFAQSHFNLEPEIAGIIVSGSGMVGVIALLNMGQLGRILTDIQMIVGGITVCAVGIISFSTLQSVENGAVNATWRYCLGILMIYGIGYPIGHTAVIGLFSKIVGRKAQGTMQGWFASAGSLARVLFPVVSGYITQYDDITTVFKVLFGILLVSNILVALSSSTLTALSI